MVIRLGKSESESERGAGRDCLGPPVVVVLTFFPRHAIEASTAVCLSCSDRCMDGSCCTVVVVLLLLLLLRSNQNIRCMHAGDACGLPG